MITTDQSALLRAVIEAPHDDAPRLIYADWLDEHAAHETCKSCGGDGYAGRKGFASDDDREWVCGTCGRPSGMYGCGLDNDGKPRCAKCSSCNGSGHVSNGNAERAEFIRVQVRYDELFREKHGAVTDGKRHCDKCYEMEQLDNRSRELLATHGERWAMEELGIAGLEVEVVVE